MNTLLEIFRYYRTTSPFAGEGIVRTYERARRSWLWRKGCGGQMCPFEDTMDWRARMNRSEYFGQ